MVKTCSPRGGVAPGCKGSKLLTLRLRRGAIAPHRPRLADTVARTLLHSVAKSKELFPLDLHQVDLGSWLMLGSDAKLPRPSVAVVQRALSRLCSIFGLNVDAAIRSFDMLFAPVSQLSARDEDARMYDMSARCSTT